MPISATNATQAMATKLGAKGLLTLLFFYIARHRRRIVNIWVVWFISHKFWRMMLGTKVCLVFFSGYKFYGSWKWNWDDLWQFQDTSQNTITCSGKGGRGKRITPYQELVLWVWPEMFFFLLLGGMSKRTHYQHITLLYQHITIPQEPVTLIWFL